MRKQRIITCVLAVGLLLALAPHCLCSIPAANATTIIVNTTDDELNSDGDCSLREAIQAANTDMAVSGCITGSGTDTITLPDGFYILTILGPDEEDNASGDLDITGSLTINGEGENTVILAGTNPTNGIDRVLDVHAGVTVELNHLGIQHGRTPAITGEEHGGGIRIDDALELTLNNSYVNSNTAGGYGGGIYNGQGPLTLNNSTVGFNTTEYGGGAICNPGTLTLNSSTIIRNTAHWWGGGVYNSGMMTLDHTALIDNTVDLYGGGIWNPGTSTLNNSTISDGAAERGGGIYSSGTLTLDSCAVSGNNATKYGGGIVNFGTLTLYSSSITGNEADSDRNLDGNGGGIWNDGPLELYGSAVTDNKATYGGGIYNDADITVILSECRIADNNGAYSGGGIYSTDPQAVVVLHRSTINGNGAGLGSGGGIYHGGGDLTLNTCTVSGNTSGQNGGGICNAAGTLALRSSTIAYNQSDLDGDSSGDGGGIYVSSGTALVRNTIIGNNSDWHPKAPDCSGTLTSQGYNLVQNTAGCNIASTTGDLFGFLPDFGALGDNGGPTWTHALLGSSPAIDWIPDGTSDCQAGVSTDQRSHLRASGTGYGGSQCDIGAYEYNSAPRVAQFSAATYSVDEGAGPAIITVTISPVSTNVISVDFATSDGTARQGNDYASMSGTLFFSPTVTSRSFSVPLLDRADETIKLIFAAPILEDKLDEADETVTLTLSDPSNTTIGGTNPVTLTIEDNDPLPTVRFSRAIYSVNEGEGAAAITVKLNTASGRLVEVDCATSDGAATAGSDYTATSERIFFYPGVTSRTVHIPISNDERDEPCETVILTLSDATNATIGDINPVILTIADSDKTCLFIYLPLVVRSRDLP